MSEKPACPEVNTNSLSTPDQWKSVASTLQNRYASIMPYLNWSEQTVTVLPEAVSREGTLVTLRLSAETIGALVEELVGVWQQIGADVFTNELRIDVNPEWVFYWKPRLEGVSRALIAHPEPKLWVGTIALEVKHGETVIELLRDCAAGSLSQVRLGEHFRLGAFSNLDLAITRI